MTHLGILKRISDHWPIHNIFDLLEVEAAIKEAREEIEKEKARGVS